MKLELFFPLDSFYPSQKFGENPSYYKKYYGINGHNGWDMVGRTGQVIRAAHDGIVTYTGADNNEGVGIVIRTKDQREYGGKTAFIKSFYWHCEVGSVLVRLGQEVSVGQPIAKCDSSGVLYNAGGWNTQGKDAASHLHFGIKPLYQGEDDWSWYNAEPNNGYAGAIDPAPYWNKFYAVDAQKVLSLYQQTIGLLQQFLDKLKGRNQ